MNLIYFLPDNSFSLDLNDVAESGPEGVRKVSGWKGKEGSGV